MEDKRTRCPDCDGSGRDEGQSLLWGVATGAGYWPTDCNRCQGDGYIERGKGWELEDDD